MATTTTTPTTAATSKSNDQLIDILKQIQARKTVKPEDATKALQQYHKVQEHIKALKTEIELFKSNKAKQANQDSTASKLPQKSNSAVVSRNNSIRSLNTIKQASPSSKISSKSANGAPQADGTVPGAGLRRQSKVLANINDATQANGTVPGAGLRRQSKVLANINDATQANGTVPGAGLRRQSKVLANINDQEKDKGTDKPIGKQTIKEEKLKPEEKQQSAREAVEKDKELTRLRLQNAQLKVTLETKTGSNSSEISPKSAVLEQRDIPNTQKLVDEFRRIHDMEYRVAFHDLEKQYKLAEDNITETLAAIAREAYTFCQNSAKQQFDDIVKAHANVIDALVQPKYSAQFKDVVTSKSKSIVDKDGYVVTRKFLKDYRRAMARVPLPRLIEIFESIVQRDVLTRHTSLRLVPKSTRPYMQRLIEVNWFMSLHEPPMAQVWPRGGQLMNRDWFTCYSKKGATVIHTVWPALFYHKEGSLAERGICVVK